MVTSIVDTPTLGLRTPKSTVQFIVELVGKLVPAMETLRMATQLAVHVVDLQKSTSSHIQMGSRSAYSISSMNASMPTPSHRRLHTACSMLLALIRLQRVVHEPTTPPL